MEIKLNKILNIIEKHLSDNVWQSNPPIKELDYKIIMLGIKILRIKDNIESPVNEKELIEYIEKEFKIPNNNQELSNWINQNQIRHRVILNIYIILLPNKVV